MTAVSLSEFRDLHSVAEALNANAPGQGIDERLRSAAQACPGAVRLTTGFGIEGQLLTAHAARLGDAIEVVTLDTGRLFPETHDLWRRTEQRYGIAIRAFAPAEESLADLVTRDGTDGFYESVPKRLACCAVRKTAPLGRALAGASVWISGLRSEQSSERRGVPFAGVDAVRGLLKINPLHDWTRQAVLDALRAGDVPVSALEARGYRSVGCAPCTRAVRAHEAERAGRWWWENGAAKECGLHVAAQAA